VGNCLDNTAYWVAMGYFRYVAGKTAVLYVPGYTSYVKKGRSVKISFQLQRRS
jgi:hypothetical protein